MKNDNKIDSAELNIFLDSLKNINTVCDDKEETVFYRYIIESIKNTEKYKNKIINWNYFDKTYNKLDFKKLCNHPYFGSVKISNEVRVYIGYQGYFDINENKKLVHDWRTNFGALYYDGKNENKIEKRKVEIESIRDYVFRDCYREKLSEDYQKIQSDIRSLGMLEDIIVSIDSFQNQIIRNDNYQINLIQGGPGTGKSTIALHILSYEVFHFVDLNKSYPKILIVLKNKVLKTYVNNILKNLDLLGSNRHKTDITTINEFDNYNETYYDYIFIDEAQDLDLNSLPKILARFDNGLKKLVLCYDPYQRIKDNKFMNYLEYDDFANFTTNDWMIINNYRTPKNYEKILACLSNRPQKYLNNKVSNIIFSHYFNKYLPVKSIKNYLISHSKGSIGIIYNDLKSKKIAEEVLDNINYDYELFSENLVNTSGKILLDIEQSKGLEFDNIVIFYSDFNLYDILCKRSLYLAFTRTLGDTFLASNKLIATLHFTEVVNDFDSLIEYIYSLYKEGYEKDALHELSKTTQSEIVYSVNKMNDNYKVRILNFLVDVKYSLNNIEHIIIKLLSLYKSTIINNHYLININHDILLNYLFVNYSINYQEIPNEFKSYLKLLELNLSSKIQNIDKKYYPILFYYLSPALIVNALEQNYPIIKEKLDFGIDIKILTSTEYNDSFYSKAINLNLINLKEILETNIDKSSKLYIFLNNNLKCFLKILDKEEYHKILFQFDLINFVRSLYPRNDYAFFNLEKLLSPRKNISSYSRQTDYNITDYASDSELLIIEKNILQTNYDEKSYFPIFDYTRYYGYVDINRIIYNYDINKYPFFVKYVNLALSRERFYIDDLYLEHYIKYFDISSIINNMYMKCKSNDNKQSVIGQNSLSKQLILDIESKINQITNDFKRKEILLKAYSINLLIEKSNPTVSKINLKKKTSSERNSKYKNDDEILLKKYKSIPSSIKKETLIKLLKEYEKTQKLNPYYYKDEDDHNVLLYIFLSDNKMIDYNYILKNIIHFINNSSLIEIVKFDLKFNMDSISEKYLVNLFILFEPNRALELIENSRKFKNKLIYSEIIEKKLTLTNLQNEAFYKKMINYGVIKIESIFKKYTIDNNPQLLDYLTNNLAKHISLESNLFKDKSILDSNLYILETVLNELIKEEVRKYNKNESKVILLEKLLKFKCLDFILDVFKEENNDINLTEFLEYFAYKFEYINPELAVKHLKAFNLIAQTYNYSGVFVYKIILKEVLVYNISSLIIMLKKKNKIFIDFILEYNLKVDLIKAVRLKYGFIESWKTKKLMANLKGNRID